jgi:diadenosine tetraphosphate (Ap4A) HIT family hydrolase
MRRRESFDPDYDLNICRFCYPSQDERIVYEDDSIYVVPSRGHFVNGYLLLISKEHIDCTADTVDDHLRAVKNRVTSILESHYGSYCIMEHGRVGSCYKRANNRICYHAHLHCLPVPENFHSVIEQDFTSKRVDDITEISEYQEKSPHYMYLETFDGEKRFFEVSGKLERQYLRKKACEALGIETKQADWKQNPHWDRMEQTADELEDANFSQTR